MLDVGATVGLQEGLILAVGFEDGRVDGDVLGRIVGIGDGNALLEGT